MSGPLGIENDVLARLAETVGPHTPAGDRICYGSGAALTAQAVILGDLAPLVVLENMATDTSDESSRADHIIEDQSWDVTIVVQHRADPKEFRVDYGDLDELVKRTIAGLTGWQPSSGLRELRYVGRSGVSGPPGFVMVTLSFNTFYHLSATT